MNKVKCLICENEFKNLNGLTHHIKKTHHIDTKNYYDTYIRQQDEGYCPCCGKETSFNRFSYRRFCSQNCNGIYTLQKTPDNIKKRKEAISKSDNIKISHNTKEFKKQQSEIRKKYYENEENKKKHLESLQNLPPRTKEYREFKSIQQSEIINSYSNLQHYYYDELHFHSSWELAYYIYCKDNNIKINRKVDKIPYKFNDITYNYIPDFIVDDVIVEIKNPCLMSKLLIENTKDNAKYKKMLELNVKIITDCSEFLKYINNTYGKNYLQNYRR